MALTKTPIELSSTPSIVDGGNATAITIDSSENVLVGTTDDAPGAGNTLSGVAIRGGSDNRSFFSASSNYAMHLNRNTSDGEILYFAKDGTAVGSIGSNTGDKMYIGTGASGVGFSGLGLLPFNTSTNAFTNNTLDLGANGIAWKDLYLSGGAYLGGTGAANKLDDYEEGTWTPTDASGAGLAITVNAASYTKIGRSCYISAYITYPTNSSIAAQQLGGLPFTTRSPNTYAQLSVRVVAAAFVTNNVTFQTQTNSNYGKIHFATTVPDNSDLSGLSFLISGVYETA